MPSLGITDSKETMMNVVAMGILVITVIVNICIQFVTGVIYVFKAEHAVIMLLMLILLMTMFSSAIAIPTGHVGILGQIVGTFIKICWKLTDIVGNFFSSLRFQLKVLFVSLRILIIPPKT